MTKNRPYRDHTFFRLGELNQALHVELERYNDRPLSHEAGTRRSRFRELDQPALRALPQRPYEYATWKRAKGQRAKVFLDYHIEFEGRYDSVPYCLIA